MTQPSALSRLLPDPGRIVADLLPLDERAYDHCAQAYVQALRTLPGVQSVARFGGVSLPGVSDLDLLVVVDDDALPSAAELSDRTIAALPHGSYLCWHAPALIPRSLLLEALALHSFENLTLLHGTHPTALVRQEGILSSEFRALRCLLWNSFFWRAALSLPRAQPSLRFLLLTAGNFAQSAAHTLRVLGENADADTLLATLRQRRWEIASRTGSAQARALVELLADLLTYWHGTDWRWQAWWEQHVPLTEARTEPVCLLGHDAAVRFARMPDEAPVRLPWLLRLDDLRHRRPPRATLTLPMCYLHLASWLRPDFAPPAAVPNPAELSPAWRSAVQTLRGHLAEVVDLMQRRPDLPRQTLAEVFILPFAQPLTLFSPTLAETIQEAA